ncbi:excalibur calcium-binding domain-containing protein [Arthrobacter sp. 2YAF22_2]|uniref:excalibur calcium-binding domain-containing protein n=1 Tax=Arthrobacter sp. 2YAF22_2 TaxID=3233029 RepID=UPI003F8DC49B
MKKITAGLTFAAVVGLSALSATPALAVTGAYPNCAAAAAEGVYNIPVGAPGYGTHLDSDGDGIGCEKSGVAYKAAQSAPVAAPVAPATGTKQIVRVPVGGADTGVATKGTDNTTLFALGGGFTLAAAAAGVIVVRRRNA